MFTVLLALIDAQNSGFNPSLLYLGTVIIDVTLVEGLVSRRNKKK